VGMSTSGPIVYDAILAVKTLSYSGAWLSGCPSFPRLPAKTGAVGSPIVCISGSRVPLYLWYNWDAYAEGG